ncbi:MAG: tripartite tricarboxylate transporter substrate-binding protein [Burkholderiaceae bacterium]
MARRIHLWPKCLPASSWVGILAPAKTPLPAIERLNRELNTVLAAPETAEQLAKPGIAPTPGTPEVFAAQFAMRRRISRTSSRSWSG